MKRGQNRTRRGDLGLAQRGNRRRAQDGQTAKDCRLIVVGTWSDRWREQRAPLLCCTSQYSISSRLLVGFTTTSFLVYNTADLCARSDSVHPTPVVFLKEFITYHETPEISRLATRWTIAFAG